MTEADHYETVAESTAHQAIKPCTTTDALQWKNCNNVLSFEAPKTLYCIINVFNEPQKHGGIIKDEADCHNEEKLQQ